MNYAASTAEIIPEQGLDFSDTVTVLIIDDNHVDRRRLRRLMDTTNLPVSIDDTPSLAGLGEKLDGRSYDLVFIDYRLPEGNGLDALDMIKRHPAQQGVATIMVAGDAQAAVAVSALKSGCDDYVAKYALSREALHHSVYNALHSAAIRQSALLDIDLRQTGFEARKGASGMCFEEMRPILARMLRQIRFVGRGQALSDAAKAQMLSELEGSCVRLWEFFRKTDEGQPRWKPAIH